jgi:hypothetical protein
MNNYRPKNAAVEIVTALFKGLFNLIKKLFTKTINMKAILFFTSLIFSTISFCQVADTIGMLPSGKHGYEEIVNLDTSYTKELLYKRAKLYFVDNYKSANDVIQYDDKEEGKIVGKGFFKTSESGMILLSPVTYMWDVYYTTEITSKDGKYRYRFYDINIKQREASTQGSYDTTIPEAMQNTKRGSFKKLFTKLIAKTAGEFKASQKSLKDYMSKANSKSNSDF